MTSRRSFIQSTAATFGAFGSGLFRRLPPEVFARPADRLRILILGGTGFIGPYQVQYALDRGHTVTLFNRGKTNPQLFPTVEKLVGDRGSDLKSLEKRDWDVVIDNSATDPAWVERSAALLQNSVKRYIFVSTRSVYFDTSRVPMTIDAPVFTRENTAVAEGRPLPYGLAKAESEKTAQKYFPGRCLIIRPSLIVGPGDLTDRFTYWPVRIERGGEVLAPGDGTDPVQIIDARDLSEWIIRLAELETTGVYNALGPKSGRSFAELLNGIKAAIAANATFTWVNADFLNEHKLRGYTEIPVWMAARHGREGFARFDITRELALGLTFRSLEVTTRDTLTYFHAQPIERQETLKSGIPSGREAEVLAAWKARKT